MSLGFLEFSPGTDQQNGFFVDRNNNVLYWPTKKAPGYIVPTYQALSMADTNPDAILSILHGHHWTFAQRLRGALWGQTLGRLAGAALGGIPLSLDTEFLTPGGGIVLLCLGLFALPRPILRIIHHFMQVPRRRAVLNVTAKEILNRPRPPARTLKPSAVLGWRFYFHLLGAPLIAAFLGVLATLDTVDTPPGDRLVFYFAATYTLSFAVTILEREVIGVGPKDTWRHGEKPPTHQPASRTRRLPRIGRWILLGWSKWVWLGALFVLLSWIQDNEPRMIAEIQAIVPQ